MRKHAEALARTIEVAGMLFSEGGALLTARLAARSKSSLVVFVSAASMAV